jgi:hypothetical protein
MLRTPQGGEKLSYTQRRLLILVMMLVAVVGATPARAAVGTIDDVPAATLLLPYFEVNLDDPFSLNTLFSINNASASATLAHVTVWSTWSIPVLDFDVYLTGFDVQTINLNDVLVNGFLPNTASAGQDPTDTISPHGPISQDINFASCTGFLPYSKPAVSPSFRTHLRALLTGKKSPVDNTCAGRNYGDNIARGYITVDVTNACSLLFPSSTGYFVNGGGGIAGNRNIIWGDYFYVNRNEASAQGETLVHIEAAPGTGVGPNSGTYGPIFTTPGEYTFYGRYVAGTAIDNREPLATTFAARYLLGAGFNGGTNLIVWRDSKFTPGASCTTGANFGELFQSQIVVFDEAEHPFVVVQGGPSGEPVPGQDCVFCDETQKVAVGPDPLTTPFNFGWIYLNLNHATVLDAALGPGYINIAQNWVTVIMTASGLYSVGFDAVQLDNANTAVPGGAVLPVN